MKKLFILSLAIVVVSTFSCKKNTDIEKKAPMPDQELRNGEANKKAINMQPGVVLYKASEEYLKEQVNENLQNMMSKIKQKGGVITYEFPVYECARLVDASSVLQSITVLDGNISCGGPATIEVVFLWTVFERAGAIRPDYTFTVTPNILFGITYTGSFVQLGPPVGYNCHPEWGCWGNYTNYAVTVVMDYYNFTAPNTTNTTTAIHSPLGPCKGEPPVTLSHTGNLDFPCSYYTSNVTHVNVFNGTGQVGVYDYCHTFCNGQPPHYLCPNSLTFTYNGPVSGTQNILGGAVIPLPQGNYTYSCTANYNCGTSLPKTGTFTVF